MLTCSSRARGADTLPSHDAIPAGMYLMMQLVKAVVLKACTVSVLDQALMPVKLVTHFHMLPVHSSTGLSLCSHHSGSLDGVTIIAGTGDK